MIGWVEILVIFVLILILFGPKRLPELAKALGSAGREFKKAFNEEEKPKKRRRSKKLVG